MGGPTPHIPETETALPDEEQIPASPTAADSVTIGSVTATGNSVDVPVYIRDLSGTALGNDQAVSSRIQAFSMKVSWSPASAITSVTFTRSGITTNLSPASESRPSTSSSVSLIDSYDASTPIPFTSNGSAPGDLVAHLVVTLSGSAAPGSTVTLSLDPAVTVLGNQAGTVEESSQRATLALVNGGINIPVHLQALPPSESTIADLTFPPADARASSATGTIRAAQRAALHAEAPLPRSAPEPRRTLTGMRPFTLNESYTATTNHDAAFTYDEAGDVKFDDQGRAFTYDALSMTATATLPLTGGGTQNFAHIYTADDERIAVIEKLSSGDTKARWTLRGLDNRALRTWTDNTTNGTHTWGWSEDEIFAGAVQLAYASAIGIRHYGIDHLNSTAVVTDANGHLVGTLNYDAFGVGGATNAGMLQYTGHERDAANVGTQTGTATLPDYLHARYYSPTLGRFLTVDAGSYSISAPQSWNRYAYVRNSPLTLTDPTGLDPCKMTLPDGTETEGECVSVEADAPNETVEIIADTIDMTAFDFFRLSGTGNMFSGFLQGDAGKIAKGYGQQVMLAAPGGIASGLRPLALSGDVVFSGTTTLFRSMSQAEFEQVLAEGAFKAGPNSLEGKWFAETLEHANQWGDALGNPRTVSVEMPTSVAKWLLRLDRLDGIGPARWAEMQQLLQAVIKSAR